MSDLRLSYSDTGSGLPVVFLHPTPLTREYWRPLSERLMGVRAILPDLRGHGQSPLGTGLPVGGFAPVPDAPVLSMSQLAEDVLALLDSLELPSAVFVGCSIGGYVLFELWRQAPERVRGLAFVCSKPQPDATAAALRRAQTIARVRAGESPQLFDAMARSLCGETAQERDPAILARLRAQMLCTPEALVAVQAGLATRPDSLPTVSTLTVPLLAIAGGEDLSVTEEEMRVLSTAPGSLVFQQIDDAGHFAAFEQPDRVAALLQPWLDAFRG
jgi:pimeloyl-ACP methyl ester carboxylesterase